MFSRNLFFILQEIELRLSYYETFNQKGGSWRVSWLQNYDSTEYESYHQLGDLVYLKDNHKLPACEEASHDL